MSIGCVLILLNNFVMKICVSYTNLLCKKSSFNCISPHSSSNLQFLTKWQKHTFEPLGVNCHTSTSHDVVPMALGFTAKHGVHLHWGTKNIIITFPNNTSTHTFIHLLVTIPSLYHTYLLTFYFYWMQGMQVLSGSTNFTSWSLCFISKCMIQHPKKQDW